MHGQEPDRHHHRAEPATLQPHDERRRPHYLYRTGNSHRARLAFALSFQDDGFLPINSVTFAGLPQDLKGKFDGLFILYSGQGTQNFVAPSAPTTADCASLHYNLVGYKGDITFGHAANGTPTVSGGKRRCNLQDFGSVSTTVKVDGRLRNADLSVSRAAGDIGILPTGNGFTLDGGKLSAMFHI